MIVLFVYFFDQSAVFRAVDVYSRLCLLSYCTLFFSFFGCPTPSVMPFGPEGIVINK